VNNPITFSRKNILIVCHTYVKGAPQELEDFFVNNKARNVIFIGHPFSYCYKRYGMKGASHIRTHHSGNLVYYHEAIDWRLPDLLMYMKDVFYTVYWSLTCGVKFDIMFGADCLNALICLFLRTIGRGKTVCFYTIDYFRSRFKNRALNAIYFLMDKICVERCDWVWNVSTRIRTGREEEGIPIKYRDKQLTVPIGTKFDEAQRLSVNEIDRHKVVFLGDVHKQAGIYLLIDSIPEIIARVPKTRFVIIGGGEHEVEVKQIIKQRGFQKYVEFKGVVTNRKHLEKLLSMNAIGVAPYKPGSDSHSSTYFADPTKPKDYMALGLPVVITRVPQIADEIDKNRAGFAINYNKDEFVNAVVNLLSDDQLYKECRENALKLASKYSWDRIFTEALEKMERTLTS